MTTLLNPRVVLIKLPTVAASFVFIEMQFAYWKPKYTCGEFSKYVLRSFPDFGKQLPTREDVTRLKTLLQFLWDEV